MNNNQMGMPPMATEPKKNNTTMIIVIVVVVLCCCCGIIGSVLAWGCGDMLTNAAASCSFGF